MSFFARLFDRLACSSPTNSSKNRTTEENSKRKVRQEVSAGGGRVLVDANLREPTTQLSKKQRRPICVSIQGNIGSGKSTVLSGLRAKGYAVIEEPIESAWGQHLPLLYKDPERWSFAFEMEVLDWHRRVQGDHLDDCEFPIVFVERDAENAVFAFGGCYRDSGKLSDWEYDLLKRFSEACFVPDYHIYIRTSPSVCVRRIMKRDRTGEESVPSELIEGLRKKEDGLYLESHEVHVIDGDQGRDTVLENVLQAVETILARGHSKTWIKMVSTEENETYKQVTSHETTSVTVPGSGPHETLPPGFHALEDQTCVQKNGLMDISNVEDRFTEKERAQWESLVGKLFEDLENTVEKA